MSREIQEMLILLINNEWKNTKFFDENTFVIMYVLLLTYHFLPSLKTTIALFFDTKRIFLE